MVSSLLISNLRAKKEGRGGKREGNLEREEGKKEGREGGSQILVGLRDCRIIGDGYFL